MYCSIDRFGTWKMRWMAMTFTFVIGTFPSASRGQEKPLRLPMAALRHYAARSDSTPQLDASQRAELMSEMNELETRLSAAVEPWLVEPPLLQNESLYMAAIVTHHRSIDELVNRSDEIRFDAILRSLPLESDADRERFAKAFPSIPADFMYADNAEGLNVDQVWARDLAWREPLKKFGQIAAKKWLPYLRQQGPQFLKDAAKDELRDKVREKIFGSDMDELMARTKAIQIRVEQIHQRGEKLPPASGSSADDLQRASDRVDAITGAVNKLLQLEDDSLEQLKSQLEGVKADHAIVKQALEQIAEGVAHTHEAVVAERRVVDANRRTLLANADRLSELELALLPQMSARQQLRLVQKGHLEFADDAQRAAAESRLKVHIIADDAQAYLDDANQVLTGLATLGIADPEVTKICGDAIRIGGAVSDSMKSLASGNYIGAIGGLIGGILGGGPSTDHIVLAKLDQMYKLQIDTYNQVIEVRKDIAKLADQIRRQHNEILSHFAVVEQQLNKVLGVLDALLQEQVRLVYEALSTAGPGGPQRPLTFDELLEKLAVDPEFRKDVVGTHYRTMTSLVGTAGSGGFHASLKLKIQETIDPQNAEQFGRLTSMWQGHLALLEKYGLSNVPFACSRPAMTIADLNRLPDRSSPPWQPELFSELLSPARVVEASELVMRIAPLYWCITKAPEGQYAVLDRSQLDSSGRPLNATWASNGNELYYRAIALVDIALMQQSVLQGDFVLPRLASPAQREEARTLLESNPIFRDNLALWLLVGDGDDKGDVHPHAYGTFREFENVQAIKEVFPRLQNVALVRSDAITYMDFPIRTEFPPVSRFISGELQTSSEFEMLLAVRRRLAKAVNEANAINALTEVEAVGVNRMIIENRKPNVVVAP